ncbi:MAG TPA: hypothetical protein VIO60_06695 [Rectinemataceae bacterium]
MEIPLSLRRRADGTTVYGIPLWYRIMTAAILAFAAGGLAISGEAPGIIGYVVLALLVIGLLYQEIWILDPANRRLTRKEGIFPLSKTIAIGFEEISSLRLSALATGTVPGSAEEKLESEKAFSILKGGADEAAAFRANEKYSLFKPRKKHAINLVIGTKGGEDYLVDSVPASSAKRLLELGKAISSACGVEMIEG